METHSYLWKNKTLQHKITNYCSDLGQSKHKNNVHCFSGVGRCLWS